jgi:hypothetical protein
VGKGLLRSIFSIIIQFTELIHSVNCLN